MEILGVKFAPLNVPLERRLQTLAVAIYFIVLPFGSVWGYLITVYFIFYIEPLRYFLLLYFLWMYYDWDTCHSGGRSEMWTRVTRNNAILRYLCNYFPIKLVKTVDLDPKKSYLFVSEPHGIFSSGIIGSFGTDVLNCKKLFPGLEINPITLDQFFKVPILREYSYSLGACSSSLKSIKYLLSTPPKNPHTGRIIVLVVGGAAEMMESMPGTYRVIIKRRKGFVRLALKYGTALVPVLSFGETDLYNQIYSPEGSTFRRIQNYIRNFVGLPPVVFSGRGFFQYSFGLIPKRLPVTVVVGSPVEMPKIEEPTSEEINKYHNEFINHLIKFFNTQKHNYIKNAENVTLELL
ncbi:PREDICTED: diacylglycerol O-acyltransferase 2-like [Cyphomyrmex costatus]|uniref:diacylglycerol O-acyltransferase 2-like n=1 Tax=Cyphomyrmex costatus TaxID=456900 RepID=UPI00085224BE|nr:PREDICTED: diacylglycerol O-acyltransferase 2-like [Cyphomyrmex costatus]